MVRSIIQVLAVVAIVSLGNFTPADAQEKISFQPALEAFLRGEFSSRTLPGLDVQRAREIQPVLSREATLWIAAGPAEERDRRRLIAASIALHVANSLGEQAWREAYNLLEWGCKLVRRNSHPSEAERLWHWAAIATTQASGYGEDADLHASHATERFPAEPRFILARAVAAELQSWPDERHRSLTDRNATIATLVRDRFRATAKHPAVKAEAHLRLGFFFLRHRYAAQALKEFQEAGETEEPYLRYLTALFEGRAHDQEGRLGDAITAYRRAVLAVRGAQTAELALASALARAGRLDEAYELVRTAIQPSNPPADPWIGYGQGDLRFWPSIASALEAALR
jgi:tetratricopeptide (TPR) repeat protein